MRVLREHPLCWIADVRSMLRSVARDRSSGPEGGTNRHLSENEQPVLSLLVAGTVDRLLRSTTAVVVHGLKGVPLPRFCRRGGERSLPRRLERHTEEALLGSHLGECSGALARHASCGDVTLIAGFQSGGHDP